ncbi:ArsR/SmtB family transcription factor [Amycolatopsis sp. WGS_07]|uniref:ArsR/SmtB family transcription factor n=1 Tax=Amycolatopsis sp. WGS_07 TaxID=3076764 RepID=UPI003872C896
MDDVFRALADPSRRRLLDRLNHRNGQNLRELCDGLGMSRQAVTKHLLVLQETNLVTTARRGREKLHYLNVAPINDIAERWIDRYDRERAGLLSDLKRALEGNRMPQDPFVYVTYIETTPEQLWQALTTPAFIARYFQGGPESSWTEGAPVRWRTAPGGEPVDLGQRVLVAEPCRRLAYTWHNYPPESAEAFGWSEATLAERRREAITQVTFDLEPVGSAVRLTVTHDGFEGRTAMYEGVSKGWPEIVSNLKTLLETGDTLSLPADSRTIEAAVREG